MFDPTPNHTKHKSSRTATIMAIAKPLALMGALLTISPSAFGRAECTARQLNISETNCSDRGMIHYDCYQNADGGFTSVCCTVGAPCDSGGGIAFDFESDGEMPEDDDRGEPTDTSTSPGDADELVDEEPGFSDDDGDIRGADDGDTDPDERLEIGACCVDLACIDDLTADECEYEELGAWFASMDCADTVSECAAVDPGPPADDEDELVDEEPGFSDDDGDITGADDGDTGRDDDDDGDTGDDGFDTGDADDTSTADEDASVDDDDTQADGDVDTEPEVSDTSAGCSTVGQAGGGLMALILGALLGLTRRQVRWS